MSDFAEVKGRIDLAQYIGQYVPLKRSGSLMTCCCPFHSEKSPSFQVKGDHWWCRGQCGMDGDVFDFAMRYHGWSRQEALMELARYAGYTLTPLLPANKERHDKRERLYALMNDAAHYYHNQLVGEPLDYLMTTRGLTRETIDAALMGYAPNHWQWLTHALSGQGYTEAELIASKLCVKGDKTGELYDFYRGRIMIPVRDHKGRIVAFSGRAMTSDQNPKYLLPAKSDDGLFDKSRIIHTMPSNRSTKAVDAFVIVEGSLDPISAANRGISNIVSLLGKELSDAQFDALCKMGVSRLIFCLDNDEAGQKALRRLVEKHMHTAADAGVSLFVMRAPHGKDPDDTFREKPELWQVAVDAARPVVDALIDREMTALDDAASTADKIALAKRLMPILKGSNTLVTHDNLQMLADALGYPVDVIEGWMRPQLSVIRNPNPPKAHTTLPTREHWILYYALCFDEYMDRIAAALSDLGLQHRPYREGENFFYRLMPCDFQDETLRALMVMVRQAWAEHEDARTYVEAHLEKPVHKEAYERCVNVDQWSRAMGVPPEVSFDMALRMALDIRMARLERESQAHKAHRETYLRYRHALTLLQHAQEAM